MWSHGSFYWNELITRDAEKAKAFYKSSIGWNFDAMPMEDSTYWVAKMADTPVGGIFTMSGAEFGGDRRQRRHPAQGGEGCRRQGAARAVRRAGGRTHRDHPGSGRGRDRLDDASEPVVDQWQSAIGGN
jgi:catechol 2,3-dioxygenase-like lactoylglutathione lyase family enzyme